MKKNVARLAIVMGVAALAVLVFQAYQPTVIAAPAEKVAICHATGPDGTHFVRLNTKALSPYGAEGHVDANGSPLSGHEQDIILGEGEECPCNKD